MQELVKILGADCPFVKPSIEEQLTSIYKYDVTNIEEKVIFDMLNHKTLEFLAHLKKEKKNPHLVNIVMFFYLDKSITNDLKEIIYKVKSTFIKEPCVYGYFDYKINKNRFMYVVVIRPYLGKQDEKFFKRYPELKKGKMTLKKFKGSTD